MKFKRFFLTGISLLIFFSLSAQEADVDDLSVNQQNDVLMISDDAEVNQNEEGTQTEEENQTEEEIPVEAAFKNKEEIKVKEETQTDADVNEAAKEEASHGGLGAVPAAKRPLPADKAKAEAAAEKDENADTDKKNRETIKYGVPSEISEVLDELIKNEDPRYTDEIYDLFQSTTNATIRQKVLDYFTQLKDPCLEDFAVNLLNDPYDEKKDVVTATFKYVQAVKTKAAVPPTLAIIESENEDYFNDALTTIGDIGGSSEALFIAEFLDRDDLADGQRQILMRTLGKMHALSTWNQIVEILENEDENSFVRMYAAEALGSMEKKESVPVLVRNYSASDPNLRQYVIKGLSYFPDVVEARATIIQAVRDEYWKVRQEAIKTCQDKNFTDAMPYLIYRAENDSEKVIKNNSFEAIAALKTDDGNSFLLKQLEDKKTGDSVKQKVVEVLLKEDHVGQKEILALADTCVQDDKRKSLRYAIGKELAKHAKPEYEEICSKYLASKDATTVSLGLDMYKNCKYSAVEAKMREIAADKKANAGNRNRIKKMLNIEDEDNTEKKADNNKKEASENNASSNGEK